MGRELLPSDMREWATSRSPECQGNLGVQCSRGHLFRYPHFQSQSYFLPIRHRRLAGAENSTLSGVLQFLSVAPKTVPQYDQPPATGDQYFFKCGH